MTQSAVCAGHGESLHLKSLLALKWTPERACNRVGPFSSAILAALVYEVAFRPDYDNFVTHRGPGVGLFPGMAGVEGEEKTGAAGDVLTSGAEPSHDAKLSV